VNIFLDVGSGPATTFDWFLSKTDFYNGWRVVCFEPSPRHWPRLLQMADHYRNQYDITLCPFGLGYWNSYLPFYEKEEPSGDSFIRDYFVNSGTRKLLCHTANAAEFINLGVMKPGDRLHVKLDCEGGEYFIIPSLLGNKIVWDSIDRLLVEFHEGEPTPGEAQRLTDECAKRGMEIEPWTL